jgi:hypothetical protein
VVKHLEICFYFLDEGWIVVEVGNYNNVGIVLQSQEEATTSTKTSNIALMA